MNKIPGFRENMTNPPITRPVGCAIGALTATCLSYFSIVFDQSIQKVPFPRSLRVYPGQGPIIALSALVCAAAGTLLAPDMKNIKKRAERNPLGTILGTYVGAHAGLGLTILTIVQHNVRVWERDTLRIGLNNVRVREIDSLGIGLSSGQDGFKQQVQELVLDLARKNGKTIWPYVAVPAGITSILIGSIAGAILVPRLLEDNDRM